MECEYHVYIYRETLCQQMFFQGYFAISRIELFVRDLFMSKYIAIIFALDDFFRCSAIQARIETLSHFSLWQTEYACYTKRSKVNRSRHLCQLSNVGTSRQRPTIDEANAHRCKKRRNTQAHRRHVQLKSNTLLPFSPKIIRVSGDTWCKYHTRVTSHKRSSSPDACKILHIYIYIIASSV